MSRVKESRGFTMLELIIVIAILGLMASIALPNGMSIYQRTILRNSANEVESALIMARQLSMDESKSYEVLLSESRFSIRGVCLYRSKNQNLELS